MNCPKKRETRPFFISGEGCDDITLCTLDLVNQGYIKSKSPAYENSEFKNVSILNPYFIPTLSKSYVQRSMCSI